MRALSVILCLSELGAAASLGACDQERSTDICPSAKQWAAGLALTAPAGCPKTAPPTDDFFPATRAVDILFLIDNSPSMSPKQKALAQNIPKFIQKIDAAFPDYHVGIATSDIGSERAPGLIWGGNLGSCDTFAGDDGQLQAIPCTQRRNVTQGARTACDTLCPDDRYVPVDGRHFISKSDAGTNVPVKLEPDPMTGKPVDTGPIKAFQCLALVGDGGCGVEGQLEGSRRALNGHHPDNVEFLRPGSFLAVIYVTDEDDCSVQLARRHELNPQTRDCDPTKPDDFDCYNIDYRCLARSTTCTQTLLTTGVKTGCRERPGSYLEPTENYYKFFSALRPPSRLLISGIWTLPDINHGGRVEIVDQYGLHSTSGLNRAPKLGASCSYSADPGVYGQPQHRLSKFAGAFGRKPDGTPGALELSICDVDHYPDALAAVADTIVRSASFPG